MNYRLPLPLALKRAALRRERMRALRERLPSIFLVALVAVVALLTLR